MCAYLRAKWWACMLKTGRGVQGLKSINQDFYDAHLHDQANQVQIEN